MVAPPLRAQVGHAPGASPYHDIRASQFLLFTGGLLTGGEGIAGVGPSNGMMAGVRYELRVGAPTRVVLGIAGGGFDRVVLDPRLGAADRVQDTVTQSVILGEAGLQFVLTGAKSWHGVAPYLGVTTGLALGGEVPQDSSGFRFGTRFQLGPQVGIQWYPAQRLTLRVEGRAVFWKLHYPPLFFQAPSQALGEPPLLDNRTTKASEWVQHPALFISLGYAIKL